MILTLVFRHLSRIFTTV